MKDIYYVYYLIDPETDIPFYVGKGCDDRIYDHTNEVNRGKIPNKNKFLYHKIKKILSSGRNVIYKKIFENLNEKTSLLKEISEIKRIGRNNLGIGPLCNLTDGGEGMSGYKRSLKQKEKMKEIMLNMWKNPKYRDSYKKGRNKVDWSEVHKKQSASLKKRFENPNFLKKHRETLKKINSTEEARQENSKRIKKFYEEHPNHRKKLSEIQKQLWKEGKYNNSKHWKFISPNGNIIEFDNLQRFCRENKLLQGNMLNVFRGKRKQHKGWKSLN